jgi:hypothetical protein
MSARACCFCLIHVNKIMNNIARQTPLGLINAAHQFQLSQVVNAWTFPANVQVGMNGSAGNMGPTSVRDADISDLSARLTQTE